MEGTSGARLTGLALRKPPGRPSRADRGQSRGTRGACRERATRASILPRTGPCPAGSAFRERTVAARRRVPEPSWAPPHGQRGTSSGERAAWDDFQGNAQCGNLSRAAFFARIPMRCPSPINFPQVTFPSHCRFPEHKKSLRSLWVSVSSNWLTSQNKS